MLNASPRAKILVILSGKGGVGKTSLVAAFAHLSNPPELSPRAVFVDADVDAANLSLTLQPEVLSPQEFWGGSLAEIETAQCTGCGACVPVCRYDAVLLDVDHSPAYWIDPVACDGCGACVYACPEEAFPAEPGRDAKGAIRMVQQQEGHWFHSQTPFGTLFHAELFPGRENSGKLVTLVKQHARLWAEDENIPLVIIDGPPGIGCPVISACAGADLGLIVAEPGLAGLHDMKRALGTLQHFKIPAVICTNKADLYPPGSRQIREFAAEEGVALLGEIPFDEHIPKSMLRGAPVTQAFPESPAAQAMREIWEKTSALLFPVEVAP